MNVLSFKETTRQYVPHGSPFIKQKKYKYECLRFKETNFTLCSIWLSALGHYLIHNDYLHKTKLLYMRKPHLYGNSLENSDVYWDYRRKKLLKSTWTWLKKSHSRKHVNRQSPPRSESSSFTNWIVNRTIIPPRKINSNEAEKMRIEQTPPKRDRELREKNENIQPKEDGVMT